MQLFKRKLRIKQITSATSGEWLFVWGLGNDGKVYIWNSVQAVWLPHVNIAPEQQPQPQPEPAKKAK